MVEQKAEFGIFIPPDRAANVIPSRGFGFFKETALACERLGYEAVFVADHWMLPVASNLYEAWTVLSSLASVTSKIRLGSCVTPIPMYHPGNMAKRVSTVDHISGGRVIFGVGAGNNQEEFKAYNLPFDDHKVRIQKMIEGLEIIRKLWSVEEPVTYSGQYFSVKNAVCRPKPVQKDVPIWFGGSSNRILKLIAKYGKGWLPTRITPEEYKMKWALITKYATELGRNPSEITPGIALRIVVGRSASDVDRLLAKFKLMASYEMVAGTPSECVAKLKTQAASGVRFFRLGIMNEERYVEDAQLIADEIIPHFV
jgi:probable F420-dependent oxidoreductase